MQYTSGLSGFHGIRALNMTAETPHYIIHWIMKTCENQEAGKQYNEELEDVKGASYSHALKMRAAISWGFMREKKCSHAQYRCNSNGEWEGNPALAFEVGKYMVSLQRRKVCSIS